MSLNKREIEVRGSDVDAAIEKGLSQLGVGRNDVIIEIVDEGSRGLLGIGSRDAVVRLTSMLVPPPPPAAPKPQPRLQQEKAAPSKSEIVQPPVVKAVEAEEVDEREVAAAVIRELLDKMGVEAEVSTRTTEPDDVTGKELNVIEINGDDLGMLIGPRGETLNSLQFITRLMAGHQLRDRANFVIDVQGYRERREQALARLAERMAQKVVARRRPVSLEPMPPHERRIIHMTLRNDKDVYTQSTGEGKRRKVRILPK
ncbi:MAG: protein jag [Ardenticatenaceae bacterium]|nr:protein jag [Ardenticatenaceae bacterium]MCB9444744.1 protein jag [Ardenticatenaceae bacterium]